MMAETTFRVVYGGPALADGRMPVRDLAPALLALGDLFTEASRVVYPEGKPVALSIKATNEGSFDVHLILESQGAWEHITDIFAGDSVTALVNLKTLLIGGVNVGLFELIRMAGGRLIAREETIEPGTIRITYTDGMTVEVPAQVAAMNGRFSIRRKARDVVAPLSKEGVESVQFSETDDSEPTVTIQKGELPSFEVVTADEEVLLDEESVLLVQVASPSFEGRTWRLSLGEQTFHAVVEDMQFLEDVEKHRVTFGMGDLLRCQMRIVQSRGADGRFRTQHHVLRVIEHIPAPTQMTFTDETESAT